MSRTKTLVLLAHDERIELVPLPLGHFNMGSAGGIPIELPVRRVVIDDPVLLGKFPVTRGQWTAKMGTNPSVFTDEDRLPVDSVSWEDAKRFCLAVSELSGRKVRLPTEAEWEYACRAGSTSEYYFGDTDQRLDEYAWYNLNSNERTHPVGLKRPNSWGVFHLVGNVWGWCEDVWHGDYSNAPINGTAWMAGEASQPRRVLRGGA